MIEDKQPFSILIYSIERDLERTPEGNGGEIHFKPATPMHGTTGMNGGGTLKCSASKVSMSGLCMSKRCGRLLSDML